MAITEKVILEGLNERQKEAVVAADGPVLILAGAGSGKTRTIVHRMAYIIHVKKVSPSQIVALTFTNKAAHEMHERVLQIAGPIANMAQVRTFHSFGLFLLRQYASYLQYPSHFTIWDDSDSRGCVERICQENYKEKFNKNQIRYFVNKISSFKDSLLSPEAVAEELSHIELENGEQLVEIYKLYEIAKTNSAAFDFGDLIYQCVYLLQNYPDVLEQLQQRFRYFPIDEYQDTNHAQYAMIHLLAQKDMNLCVVGDDDQAIYGWRGADIRNILEFHQDFQNVKIVKLEENYRSTQKILDLANEVIVKNHSRMEKTLFTRQSEGLLPQFHVLPDDKSEAEYVVSKINQLHSQYKNIQMAVLYRTNTQSRVFEEAMLAKDIPYKIFGSVSFFERKEIKDIMAYLKFIANTSDEMAFLRIINNPSRGLGDKSIEKIFFLRQKLFHENGNVNFISVLREYLDEASAKVRQNLENFLDWLLPVITKVSVTQSSNRSDSVDKSEKAAFIDLVEIFNDVLQKSGLYSYYEEEDRLLATERLGNLDELRNMLSAFQKDYPAASLQDFLLEKTLNAAGETSSDLPQDYVNMMTIHNAKGLEFDVVFLCGLDDDLLPHYLAKQEDSGLEEERRLFYVAITRAKQKLFLTRALRRLRQGYYQNTMPSIFLEGLEDKSLFEKALKPLYATTPQFSPNTPRKFFTSTNLATNSANSKKEKGVLDNIQASTGSSKFKPGDSVKHTSFGIGKVMRLEGSGEATKIHIFFEDKKSRKFLLKFTQLQKL